MDCFSPFALRKVSWQSELITLTRVRKLRSPTTVMSKQNAHIKLKSLTSNSNHSQQIKNHSQQIQIAHSKLQIHHSKLQIVHIKYKSFTSNTNRSQQIQIAHSKYKYSQCKGRTADCGLRTADCGPGKKAEAQKYFRLSFLNFPPGLQSADFILHFTPSPAVSILNFTLSLQSSFYPQSAFSPGPQSPFALTIFVFAVSDFYLL